MKFKKIIHLYRKRRVLIVLIILSICLLNVLNIFLHNLPENITTTEQLTSTITTTTRRSIQETEPSLVTNITYYRLVPQRSYHYEFRFEYNQSHREDQPRVMILFNGSSRTCADYWEFAVGRRLLAYFRRYGFFILAICSRRKSFDSNSPLTNNTDARLVYTSMQRWIHEVFYEHFRQYPRLYIHAISRGSKFAAIVSRLLPIQGQIFTIYPAHYSMMSAISSHSIDLQNRLTDPIFANWFHFEFCYRNAFEINQTKEICPYGDLGRRFYQPVTPTFFVHAQNDRFFAVKDYTFLINFLQKRAYRLGGSIFNHSESMKYIMLAPLNITAALAQQFFPFWHSKPYAAAYFYRHFSNRELYRPFNRTYRTCLCLKIDFRYYEFYSNFTENWSEKERNEYRDYANDIFVYRKTFCEDLCGDLYASHAITSRKLNQALDWLNRIDSLRNKLYINDTLQRPLRIYMYNKSSLFPNQSFSTFNWMNLIKSYRMYVPEYFLQEYFQQQRNTSHQYFQLITDPLLADFYFIPHDLMYLYCSSIPINMTEEQFWNFYTKLNLEYFQPMLEKIRREFPYWTMAKREDLFGSNHIIALVNGRNMGFLHRSIQMHLKNVIQLVLTGIRQDLMPTKASVPYMFKNMSIIYRHGYDIVLPPFTPVRHGESHTFDSDLLLKKKQRLFFFAGELTHSMNTQSARYLLAVLWLHAKSQRITLQGKEYDEFQVFRGHMKPDEYIQSIESSVFSICPEGFLPWSPRLQEAIQIGAIPMILADNIVLPFERYIPWRSISAKLNVSQIQNLTNSVLQMPNFDQYIRKKLSTAYRYINAFQWPYRISNENDYIFSANNDQNGTSQDVFSYLSLELQCRSIEQLYGLTSETFSFQSKRAQRRACRYHSTICSCHAEQQSVAFQQYI